MIDKVKVQDCCLCKACSNICPKDAISFTNENYGFMYPQIDLQACIECNLCEKVCPSIKDLKKTEFDVRAYAARSRIKDERLKSTSGGIFYEVAKYFIKNGGYVCAAVFDEDFNVVHAITNDLADLQKMRGSKYVQSDIKHSYREIKKLLISGNKVLFCGCPCQSAGLKGYLQKDYDQLYIIDLVCHGIPSNKTFKDYLAYLNSKYKSNVVSFRFRDKSKGWHNSSVRVEFANGKTYIRLIYEDVYMKGFLSGTTMKESCYNCKYKKFVSGSDITIGDMWGAEVTLPQMDDNTGLSGIIVNTQKGDELLKLTDSELVPFDMQDIIKYNKNIVEASKPSENRKDFYKFANENGIANALNHFYKIKVSTKFKKNVRRVASKLYRTFLNK